MGKVVDFLLFQPNRGKQRVGSLTLRCNDAVREFGAFILKGLLVNIDHVQVHINGGRSS